MKLITFKINNEKYDAFKNSLKGLGNNGKNIKIVDVIRPTVDSYIKAARKGRAIEFIEYIKSWR